MTISIAWIRKTSRGEELIFVSDSRLCGGQRWDECPKITSLPSDNAIISFAGDTEYAYPLMMQIKQSMSGYYPVESRSMDISKINGEVLFRENKLLDSVYDKAIPNSILDNQFIFGGYSWKQKKFKFWSHSYHKTNRKMAKKASEIILPWIKGNIIIIGDQSKRYKYELRTFLNQKYPEGWKMKEPKNLDMEPFQVMCKILEESKKEDTIGGAPQMVKVGQYMSTRIVGVYWPQKEEDNDYKNRTILGRKLLDYEDTDYWFINPKTLEINSCHKRGDGLKKTSDEV